LFTHKKKDFYGAQTGEVPFREVIPVHICHSDHMTDSKTMFIVSLIGFVISLFCCCLCIIRGECKKKRQKKCSLPTHGKQVQVAGSRHKSYSAKIPPKNKRKRTNVLFMRWPFDENEENSNKELKV
jgi:hypothetical protein